jgi:hypothetical protein
VRLDLQQGEAFECVLVLAPSGLGARSDQFIGGKKKMMLVSSQTEMQAKFMSRTGKRLKALKTVATT